MFCPNDMAEMHQVKIESHYGIPIFLDQCNKCGGIWFDRAELYRAKYGEADKVELLDSQILVTPSVIKNSNLICPRDRHKLIRFTDKYFPQGIIIERCPVCEGVWLNRGEFTKYQKARGELQRSRGKNADTGLSEEIRKILTEHQPDSNLDTLNRLGRFLSTPMDRLTLQPDETVERTPEEKRALDIVLNVIMTVLSVFIPGRII